MYSPIFKTSSSKSEDDSSIQKNKKCGATKCKAKANLSDAEQDPLEDLTFELTQIHHCVEHSSPCYKVGGQCLRLNQGHLKLWASAIVRIFIIFFLKSNTKKMQ